MLDARVEFVRVAFGIALFSQIFEFGELRGKRLTRPLGRVAAATANEDRRDDRSRNRRDDQASIDGIANGVGTAQEAEQDPGLLPLSESSKQAV